MKKFILPLVAFILFSQNLFSQNDNLLINEFHFKVNNTKESTKDSLLIDLSEYSVMDIRVDKVNAKKKIENFQRELYLIDSILKYDDYPLLNVLINMNTFRVLKLKNSTLKPNDTIGITISSDYMLEYNNIINSCKELKKRHQLQLWVIKISDMKIDPITLYHNNHLGYSNYLLSFIKRTLKDNVEKLDCSFIDYVSFEIKKKLKSLKQVISMRYNFLIFCYDKLK